MVGIVGVFFVFFPHQGEGTFIGAVTVGATFLNGEEVRGPTIPMTAGLALGLSLREDETLMNDSHLVGSGRYDHEVVSIRCRDLKEELRLISEVRPGDVIPESDALLVQDAKRPGFRCFSSVVRDPGGGLRTVCSHFVKMYYPTVVGMKECNDGSCCLCSDFRCSR